jgi:hypothetical protein
MRDLPSEIRRSNVRPKIYISGPISGQPEGNKEAFESMEKRLASMGGDPQSPRRAAWPQWLSMEIPHQFDQGWNIQMRKAVAMQMQCDYVVLLPGWRDSRGAKIEVGLADEVGQVCFEYNEEEGTFNAL